MYSEAWFWTSRTQSSVSSASVVSSSRVELLSGLGLLSLCWWEGGIACEERRRAMEAPGDVWETPPAIKSFIDEREWDLLTDSSPGDSRAISVSRYFWSSVPCVVGYTRPCCRKHHTCVNFLSHSNDVNSVNATLVDVVPSDSELHDVLKNGHNTFK